MDDFAQQDMKSKTFAMALECFHRFHKGRLSLCSKFEKQQEVQFSLIKEKDGELFELFKSRVSPEVRMDEYLDNFGLTVVIERSYGTNTFKLSLKK